MIVSDNPVDVKNKLAKYEKRIKELEQANNHAFARLAELIALVEQKDAKIGRMKCQIADLRLAVRRKGVSRDDERLLADDGSPDDGVQ